MDAAEKDDSVLHRKGVSMEVADDPPGGRLSAAALPAKGLGRSSIPNPQARHLDWRAHALLQDPDPLHGLCAGDGLPAAGQDNGGGWAGLLGSALHDGHPCVRTAALCVCACMRACVLACTSTCLPAFV